jgi:membrane protein DedA with SNARE-associated domain
MKKFSLMSIAAVLLPVLIMAHPGHGDTDGYSIIHYLVEPIHAIATIGVVFAAIVYIRWQRKKSRNNV